MGRQDSDDAGAGDGDGNAPAPWFLPPEPTLDSPLPRADTRSLIDPGDWLTAQAALAPELARAAMAVGRLDQLVAAMGQGAASRLALIEAEAILWSAGTPMRREEIGLDLMDARAGTDLNAARAARWAVRRLEGQGGLVDPRGFLGLHRIRASGLPGDLAARPAGIDFDEAAAGFAALMARGAGLHPLARGAYARLAWRLSDLSPPGDVVETAVWSARAMAEGCEALAFLPLGRFGRRVWNAGGTAAGRLAAHLEAVTGGAAEARVELLRLDGWAARAREAAAAIKGASAARIVAALAARPVSSTRTVERAAAVSRDTAERLLRRFQDQGLVREITGTRRFRLWMAAI